MENTNVKSTEINLVDLILSDKQNLTNSLKALLAGINQGNLKDAHSIGDTFHLLSSYILIAKYVDLIIQFAEASKKTPSDIEKTN